MADILDTNGKPYEILDDAPAEEKTPQEITYGQKAVGYHFNPDGNGLVGAIKQDFAALIDNLNHLREMNEGNSEIVRMLSLAITEAQMAQMWAVKAVTWVY
jgi:hypothetical protein